VGNLNSPSQIVISGRKEKVEVAIERLKEAGARKVIPLDVSGAFHSSCMDSACRKIEQALTGLALHTPSPAVVSNLTADVEADPARIKENLVRQMNHRTLWEDSMRYMIRQGVTRFVEFAPGKVLKGFMKKIDPNVETVSLGTVEDFHALG
jgi:[acyl-carrier-protein] S-malonyltransferase